MKIGTPSINIKGQLLSLSTPMVMGIINITPDSFYACSRVEEYSQIAERIQEMINQGASMIDIGAQSTNTNAPLLSCQEEIKRLKHILPRLREAFPNTIFSVDTFYSEVAKMAVYEGGVDIINDVSGGQMDKQMFDTIAQLRVPYILMHMRGTPQDMMQHTNYANLIEEILLYLSQKIDILHQKGVSDIIVDPGFGFSKTLNQNYELMALIKHLTVLEQPILVGISRKSMIYRLLECTPNESLWGTTALHMYALEHGANILRVHDVEPAVHTVKIFNQLNHWASQSPSC